MADEPHSVGDILDTIEKLADENDRVVVGDLVEALGARGFGPFLIVMPLIDISPIGSVPGLPTAMALVIALIAVQMALGRKHLWFPGFVRRRSVSSGNAKKAVDKTRGVARFMDRWFHGRLPVLTSGPFVRVAAVGVILLACAVPPLELLPLATTIPMLAIAAFGLAITVRDGALMIVAMLLAVAAVTVGVGLWSGR
ncbi:exopolysaccharide biosynthesis protein [Sphingomonas endophytica]|uniref:Membrane protein n=1 Tax=Sphingomonas endophytica TaxID=869719 RepID=A0A147HXF1_9SPHN|nr:exopolysaccharide biosynthesis protein [Sphingomonas endophytica]KTT69622.1 membrane protein [Sphingomonas endophytica]